MGDFWFLITLIDKSNRLFDLALLCLDQWSPFRLFQFNHLNRNRLNRWSRQGRTKSNRLLDWSIKVIGNQKSPICATIKWSTQWPVRLITFIDSDRSLSVHKIDRHFYAAWCEYFFLLIHTHTTTKVKDVRGLTFWGNKNLENIFHYVFSASFFVPFTPA